MGLTDILNEMMQSEIDKGLAKESFLLIYKDNEKIFENGFTDFKDRPAPNDKTIFKMFSMTKPVTSLAAMICLERGLFKYDDEVGKYIPEYSDMKVLCGEGTVPAKRKMLVSDLLNMTGGMEYPNDFSEAGKKLLFGLFREVEEGYPEKTVPTLELMSKSAGFPLADQPGETWNYSLCADVLGAVIEVASGMKYSEFLKENIFKPLDMTDTDFYVPADKTDRFITMFDRKPDGSYEPWDYPFLGTFDRRHKPQFESGGAGLVSTPCDYANFALLLANKGMLPGKFSKDGDDIRLISEETWNFMTSPKLSEDQLKRPHEFWYSMKGYNYGCLMRILEDKEAGGLPYSGLGEFGWDGWGGTYFCVDPVTGVVFLYFINQTNGNREEWMKKLKNTMYEYL